MSFERVKAMHRRQMERVKAEARSASPNSRFGIIPREKRAPDVRTGTSHVHNRGAILPNGRRGCWICYVEARLEAEPPIETPT